MGQPRLRRADVLHARAALRESCVVRGRSSEPCCGACAADSAHLTHSGAVVHAGFNVSLSEDSMAELPQ